MKWVLNVQKRFIKKLNKKILIVVPLFNESKRGIKYIKELKDNIFVDSSEINFLAIDDNSTDDTHQQLLNLKNYMSTSLIIIKNEKNIGHGKSIVNGYKFSLKHKYDYVLQIDGDDNVEPVSVNQLINYSINNNLDLVLGKRLNRPDPLIRKLITKILDFNLKIRFKVKQNDSNVGVRFHTRTFLSNIYLDNLLSLKIPNAFITSFANYFNYSVSSFPVIMRNNLILDRSGTQWGTGVGFKSKIKLIKATIICFLEVNIKFNNLLKKAIQ